MQVVKLRNLLQKASVIAVEKELRQSKIKFHAGHAKYEFIRQTPV